VPRALLVFEPPDGGVAENVLQLALRLARHGWQPEVAGPPRAMPYERLDAAGVPVHRLPFVRGLRSPRQEARVLRALTRMLRAGRFDVVHAHSAKAGVLGRLAARRAGVPAVYSPHCFPFVGPVSRARRTLGAAAERRLGRHTARVVCACEAERRRALERRVAAPERLERVYYGVEPCPDGLEPDARLAALREGGPLVGAVTVLRPQKRLDRLIDAAPRILAEVPEARVAIVGDGPLRGELERRAAAHGLDRNERFAFVPFTPPSARYLRALDVFVLPSAWEAMPIGALEALACGVPQVATDVEGIGEAVDHGRTGLLLPADASGLAGAVAELLSDESRRRAMSEASRARQRDRFDADRMVAETAAVYARALDR
jgi:glycosyltransferase involved in cell wall biosynthesis